MTTKRVIDHIAERAGVTSEQAEAAIARVLGYAAASRRIWTDHRIYLDRVRALRKRGTWL